MDKRVLIAPNAFKGTLKAMEAAEIIAGVYQEMQPDTVLEICPIADGGDGTCELLTDLIPLERHSVWSFDSLGRPLSGTYGLSDKSAFVDVSSVSGVGILTSGERDALATSTYGTGVLVKDAIQKGAQNIVLGLGGSATIDLGLGILQALGLVFLNEKGREIIPFAPDSIRKSKHLQLNKPLPKVKFTCLCDVDNTFFGKFGAVPIFGPQKGIKKEDFESLNSNAEKLLDLFASKTKRKIVDQKGFGAAGGIAFGLSYFFEVELKKGASYFFDRVDMIEKVKGSDYVVTGEGRYDSQSSAGKGAFELKKIIDQAGKKSVLISSGFAGSEAGFDDFVQLQDLDFNSKNLKEKAIENLKKSMRTYLSNS